MFCDLIDARLEILWKVSKNITAKGAKYIVLTSFLLSIECAAEGFPGAM
jgi:hypothetical protein